MTTATLEVRDATREDHAPTVKSDSVSIVTDARTLAKAMQIIATTQKAIAQKRGAFIILGETVAAVNTSHVKRLASSFSDKSTPITVERIPPRDLRDIGSQDERWRRETPKMNGIKLSWINGEGFTGEMSLFAVGVTRYDCDIAFDLETVLGYSTTKESAKSAATRMIADYEIPSEAVKRAKENGLVKPSNALDKLRAKEAKLAKEEKWLVRDVEQGKVYAKIDTSAYDRAVALYNERTGALKAIAREMQHANLKYDRQPFPSMLAEFAPALPADLKAEAEAVVQIPVGHTIKRITAALGWYYRASRWLDSITANYNTTWGRTAPRYKAGNKIREEFNRATDSAWCGSLPLYRSKSMRRIRLQLNAKNAMEHFGDDQNDLLKVRMDLETVRAEIALKEAK